ncbi:hypothetical protein F2Q70_00034272 [Brassica cretica]|uniref:Uncharacterized protein n=1 Tax=Brassica cretica TaxID=69181 RepID=A0A8S9GD46_BRACR|nr:hypothetical protein F2Q68_00029211 [Brassica cretica]KAF2585685.1 hypothetical protein F2Q70_00034272 [Brassica cretica]
MDEGLGLNGGIRNSRMVVEGYDNSPRREDVEEALKSFCDFFLLQLDRHAA